MLKVKTFFGGNAENLDRGVNDWLAANDVVPEKTNTAVTAVTVRGKDKESGKPTTRDVPLFAISIWYRPKVDFKPN
jgi:hypothetical protein